MYIRDRLRLESGETLEYKARIGLLHIISYMKSSGMFRLEIIDETNIVKFNQLASTTYELMILIKQYAPIKLWEWKPKQENKT
jgi:hypothetical protein